VRKIKFLLFLIILILFKKYFNIIIFKKMLKSNYRVYKNNYDVFHKCLCTCMGLYIILLHFILSYLFYILYFVLYEFFYAYSIICLTHLQAK